MSHEAEVEVIEGSLRLDLEVPFGTCGICRMVPTAEKLDMGIVGPGKVEYHVTVCRHCLSEFAPALLSLLEAEL